MPRPTLTRKRFGRQVTLRLEDDVYQQLAFQAGALAQKNPGMQVTVSDVIRSILIRQLDIQRLHTEQQGLIAEAVQARDT